MMIFINFAAKHKEIPRSVVENFLKILSPFAPHIAEELWEVIGNKSSITQESWPKYIEELTIDEEIELVIQVNGKLRDSLMAPQDISQEEAVSQAIAREKIQVYLKDKKVVKEIFVPGKLVNLVVK